MSIFTNSTVKVAILGSGNIGSDLMVKVLREPGHMELALLTGIEPQVRRADAPAAQRRRQNVGDRQQTTGDEQHDSDGHDDGSTRWPSPHVRAVPVCACAQRPKILARRPVTSSTRVEALL